MEVYVGKIYAPIVFSAAATSVPCFIGSKVIFWWVYSVRYVGTLIFRLKKWPFPFQKIWNSVSDGLKNGNSVLP